MQLRPAIAAIRSKEDRGQTRDGQGASDLETLAWCETTAWRHTQKDRGGVPSAAVQRPSAEIYRQGASDMETDTHTHRDTQRRTDTQTYTETRRHGQRHGYAHMRNRRHTDEQTHGQSHRVRDSQGQRDTMMVRQQARWRDRQADGYVFTETLSQRYMCDDWPLGGTEPVQKHTGPRQKFLHFSCTLIQDVAPPFPP